jgi:hypothetical protein
MPNWRFAPLTVCGNRARQIVNFYQATQFDTHYGLKVIQWHLELDGVESAYPNKVIDYIYEKIRLFDMDICFWIPSVPSGKYQLNKKYCEWQPLQVIFTVSVMEG